MRAIEVKAFLTDLAVRHRVATSTQNQGLKALVFLYREVLGMSLGEIGEYARAKCPQRLPVALTREEVQGLLAAMKDTYQSPYTGSLGAGIRSS